MPTYVTTTTTRSYSTTGHRRTMGDITLNTRFLSTNRGVIKILQIICGFIICSLLCSQWYGGRSCFGEGRLGYCSGLNFVFVIINVVFFVLNFLNISSWSLERLVNVIGTVLFLIASILIVWFIIDVNASRGWLIASAALIVVEFFLFLWDVKILQGEAVN